MGPQTAYNSTTYKHPSQRMIAMNRKPLVTLFLSGMLVFMSSVLYGQSESFTEEELANSFSVKDVESPPKPVKQSAPNVPGNLKGKAGTVHVAFIIDGSGKVTVARVIKSTLDDLNDVAVNTVTKWEFEPAKIGGAGVSVRVIVPIRFS